MCNPDHIIETHQGFIHRDRGCRQRTHRFYIVGSLTGLLKGHAQIRNRVHDDSSLTPGPCPVDVVKDPLVHKTMLLYVPDSLDIKIGIAAADLGRMTTITPLAVFFDERHHGFR